MTQTPECGGEPCSGSLEEEETCRWPACYNGGSDLGNGTCLCAVGYSGPCCTVRHDLLAAKIIAGMIIAILCLCCVALSLVACYVEKRVRERKKQSMRMKCGLKSGEEVQQQQQPPKVKKTSLLVEMFHF